MAVITVVVAAVIVFILENKLGRGFKDGGRFTHGSAFASTLHG